MSRKETRIWKGTVLELAHDLSPDIGTKSQWENHGWYLLWLEKHSDLYTGNMAQDEYSMRLRKLDDFLDELNAIVLINDEARTVRYKIYPSNNILELLDHDDPDRDINSYHWDEADYDDWIMNENELKVALAGIFSSALRMWEGTALEFKKVMGFCFASIDDYYEEVAFWEEQEVYKIWREKNPGLVVSDDFLNALNVEVTIDDENKNVYYAIFPSRKIRFLPDNAYSCKNLSGKYVFTDEVDYDYWIEHEKDLPRI